MVYAYARNPNLWGFVVTTIKRAKKSEINKTIHFLTYFHHVIFHEGSPEGNLQDGSSAV